MKYVIIAALVAVLDFLVLALLAFSKKSCDGGADWMKALPSDAKICEINIPGSHDSAAHFIPLQLFARCQNLSFFDQLNSGVRFLDIRLKYDDAGFRLFHGFLDCKSGSAPFAKELRIEQVLKQCYDFLSANPSEAILFCIKEEGGNTGGSFYDRLFDKYISANPEKWFVENRIPTLGEVRGRLVLIRRFAVNNEAYTEKNSGLNFQLWSYQGHGQTSGGSFDMPLLNDGGSAGTVNLQDCYTIRPKKKWNEIIKPLLDSEPDSSRFNLNLFSTAYLCLPFLNAMSVNNCFKKYEMVSGRYYGIVLFDFLTSETAKAVFETNKALTDKNESSLTT